MPVRAPATARAAAWSALVTVLAWAARIAIVGVAVFALALLTLRFVVFPHVDRYRDDLVALVAHELRHPVVIDAIDAGWDGWNPRLQMRGFRMGDPKGGVASPLLELPAIDCTLAWTSLVFLELRFRELLIDRPRLAVRRDEAGRIHLAGMAFDPESSGDDAAVVTWLLRQPQILVRDALITWTDERRSAPELTLEGVQLRLENHFGRHRFGLRGTPPAALAAPVDVRGEFDADSIDEWEHAGGKLYARVDYADVGAWRAWLPLPAMVEQGKGAVRTWVDFRDGEVRGAVVDVELEQVRARMTPELDPLAFARVSGRVDWRVQHPRRELRATGVQFATTTGAEFGPTNVTLTLRDASGATPAGGELTFDRADLEALLPLAAAVPVPEQLRTDLPRYRARGSLTQGRIEWDGPPGAPLHARFASDFSALAFEAQGSVPGLRGVSGSVKGDERSGAVTISGQGAWLSAPRVLLESVPLDRLQAEVHWDRLDGRLRVRAPRLVFANAHAAGQASGEWREATHGRGDIDLTAHLSRADVQAMPRYLPRNLPERVHGWLVHAITVGRIDDARLRLKGPLDAFPFPGGKGGTFLLTAQAKGMNLAFAAGWPALSGVEARLRFDGAAIRIEASDARILGARVTRATAEIPNLLAHPAELAIDGDASGPTTEFLRFLAESPVGGWIGHPERSIVAAGDGRLALKLLLPLGALRDYRIDGEYTMEANEVRVAGAPALQKVTGAVTFDARGVRGRDISAEVLGGSARLSLASADRGVRVNAAGNTAVANIRREYPVPLLERVTGTIDWTLALETRADATSWVLESPLRGAVVDLPAPLRKQATEGVALRVERRATAAAADEDLLFATYGRQGALAAHRRNVNGTYEVDRMQVALGRAVERGTLRADRPGLWVRAEVPALDLDAWLALRGSSGPAGARGRADELALNGVELDAGVLDAFDRRWTQLKVNARRVQSDWRLELQGKEVAGQATWSAPGPGAPNGRMVARLARLSLPAARDGHDEPQPPSREAPAWPELDITADAFASSVREYGRLELRAQPRESEWRIERLLLANDAARMTAQGAWRPRGRPQQTRLDLTLDVADGGALLARFGHPGVVQGAAGRVNGQLTWAGAPSEFDYPSLNGSLRLEVGSGRFMKTEPGLGKLLGVLSLQALPRRITLDFRDVFSEGFTFDRVTGDVRIQNGLMTTENLRMAGTSAQVVIAGDADLATETQRLRVRVQPTLTAGVSAGAALFFLANPVVGAAVGAGSLIAQKVLRDPIEQMFSYQYLVTGSWSDPVVSRRTSAAADHAQR